MKHYEMIKFFNSLEDTNYSDSAVKKLLKEFQPNMTQKMKTRISNALNKYLLKAESKILSKYSEKELEQIGIEFELKHGYLPKIGGLNEGFIKSKENNLVPYSNPLRINYKVLLYNKPLGSLYNLKAQLRSYPVVPPYKSFTSYFGSEFKKSQIKEYTSNIDNHSRLKEKAILLAALFQNEIILPPKSLLDILRALCDYTGAKWKNSYPNNIYDYLDRSPKGWIYFDESCPEYIYYDKKVSGVFL